MAQYTNFAALPTQVPDYSGYENILQNFMRGYQAARMPKQMQQEEQMNALKQALLQNEVDYAPKISEADLNSRNLNNQILGVNARYAEPMAKGELSGLNLRNQGFGLQNTYQGMQNKYYPQEQQARMSLLNAQSQEAQQKIQQQRLLENLLSGSSDGSSDTSITSSYSNGNYSSPMAIQSGNPISSGASEIIASAGNPQLSKIDAIWKNNPQLRPSLEKMGFGSKQQITGNPRTGETMIVNTLPSGKTTIQAIQAGMSPLQISRQNELGKNQAKDYQDTLSQSEFWQKKSDTLSNLSSMLKDPRAKDVLGPINAPLTYWSGSKEGQELLGQVRAVGGDFFLETINSMKGAASDRDTKIVEKMKINDDDPYNVTVGKAKALSLATNLMKRRNDLKLKYLDEGYSQSEALRMAEKQTDFQKYKKEFSPFSGWGSEYKAKK